MVPDHIQYVENSITSLVSICASISQTTSCTSHNVRHAKTVLASLQTLKSKLQEMAENSAIAHQAFLSQQDHVEDCIRNVRSIISPARWLPYELIGEILHHYLALEKFIQLPVQSDHPNPILFAQVCQRWRTVALTTSKVWASIHVEIRQCFKGGREKNISSLVDLCLQRSGNQRLKIRFTVFPLVTTWPRCDIQEDIHPIGLPTIFSSLLRYSNRWHELFLDIGFPVLKTILQGVSLSDITPVLNGFHLTGGIVSDDPRHFRTRVHPIFLDLASSLSLRKVTLQGIGLLTAQATAFPWRALEEVSFTGTYPGIKFDDYAAILRQCSALKSCKLSITEKTRSTTSMHADAIVLRALEYLHITEHSLPDGTGDIFSLLVCPNLQGLMVQYVILESDEPDSEDLSWTTDAIATFLDGSPLLTSLHLWNIPTSERGVVDVLHHVPHLTHLTLASWGAISAIGNQLLFELTVHSPPHPHVLLQQLKYVHLASRGYSEHFLFGFIQSRRIFSGRAVVVEEVHLDLLGNSSECRLRSRLHRFEEEGLKLVIVNN